MGWHGLGCGWCGKEKQPADDRRDGGKEKRREECRRTGEKKRILGKREKGKGTGSIKGKLRARGAGEKDAEMDVWMMGGKWTEE